MQWITIGSPPFSVDKVDTVLEQLGPAPDGMEARYVTTTDDGQVRIVSLWQSKEHADRFFADRLGPTLARVLGPQPDGASSVEGLAVERSYVRQPAA